MAGATLRAVVPDEPRVPASPNRQVSGPRVLVACTAVAALMVAMSLVWRLAHEPQDVRGIGEATMPSSAPSATVDAVPPSVAMTAPRLPPPLPPTSASAAVPAAPGASSTATIGTVRVTVAGHRIFIDGRLAGEGPRALSLSCGPHQLRIGSAGAIRAIDVPCGGEVVVGETP
ncbi:MAG: hypothetical protein ACLQVI_17775 [Polyangiaceae bacterium]